MVVPKAQVFTVHPKPKLENQGFTLKLKWQLSVGIGTNIRLFQL